MLALNINPCLSQQWTYKHIRVQHTVYTRAGPCCANSKHWPMPHETQTNVWFPKHKPGYTCISRQLIRWVNQQLLVDTAG